MVACIFSEELKSSIPAARLWKAMVVDIHNLLPKIAPQFIASMEIVEGDGGVGTVKVTNFTPGVGELTSVRSRIDVINEANFEFKYSIIDPTGKLDIASYEYKFDALVDGGSVCKMSAEQKAAGDLELTEEQNYMAKDTAIKTFMGIGAYLNATPNAYAETKIITCKCMLYLSKNKHCCYC